MLPTNVACPQDAPPRARPQAQTTGPGRIGRLSVVYMPRVRTGTTGKTPIDPIPSATAPGSEAFPEPFREIGGIPMGLPWTHSPLRRTGNRSVHPEPGKSPHGFPHPGAAAKGIENRSCVLPANGCFVPSLPFPMAGPCADDGEGARDDAGGRRPTANSSLVTFHLSWQLCQECPGRHDSGALQAETINLLVG